MEPAMRKVILILTLTLLAACNTIGGLGEDMRQGGEAIKGAAK
jgi:predicted small secreted protein